MSQSLQEKFAPLSICYGCGPANLKGLRIRSIDEGDEVVCEWTPEMHHHAFPGVLNGGIIGTLLDCHLNWTSAWHLMKKNNSMQLPCTVTAEYTIKMRKPTPMNTTLFLRAKLVEASEDRATIEGSLSANGIVTATARGIFVAVKEGHPAYHRW